MAQRSSEADWVREEVLSSLMGWVGEEIGPGATEPRTLLDRRSYSRSRAAILRQDRIARAEPDRTGIIEIDGV